MSLMLRHSNSICVWLGVLCCLCDPSIARADTEILFIRHAEKPLLGLGQLSCKGFNRSLALSGLLNERFGNLDTIIAPNPGVEKSDHGKAYSYIRPLATVEPTAVKLGLPVNVSIGYDNIDGLVNLLNHTHTNSNNQRVLVAWEHHYIEKAVRRIVEIYNIAAEVPAWSDDDFDSIYIVKLKNSTSSTFSIAHQNLNGLTDICPY